MFYLVSFLNQVCGFHLRLSPAAAAAAAAQFCVYAAAAAAAAAQTCI